MIFSPSSNGILRVNAPCVGATRYTVVMTRQSRSSSMTRLTRANTGNRLLSQRTLPSPPVSDCRRVSCSEPDVRRRSLIPATNHAPLLTVMTRGGVRNGISRLSTAGTAPRKLTVCRAAVTRNHRALSGALTMRAPPPPSSSTVSGCQPSAEPGSGIAISSSACTTKVMLMAFAPTSTSADTISAHRGTHSGASSKRCSSCCNNSASGMSASAGEPTPMSPASMPAASTPAVCWRPIFSPPGKVQLRLKTSAASTPANSSSNATAATRKPLTSQRGMTTSRIVCPASTGPLQLSEYEFQRHDGMPGPACTIAFGA